MNAFNPDRIAREHTDALNTLNFGQVVANLPNTLTPAQTTLTYDADFGAWRTAPVETELRDIDDTYTADENQATPFLAAEIYVTDWKALEPVQQEDGAVRPGGTVDGRFTQLMLSYGTSTGTVSPAKALQVAREMREFAARLEALCYRANEIAKDDFEAPTGSDVRCPAAHHEDATPCGGPIVVTILDRQNSGADGCEHHGARLLASLTDGRVYALPDAPDGAAIRVFRAAGTIRPFPWVDGPRTEPSQLSHAENERGEHQ